MKILYVIGIITLGGSLIYVSFPQQKEQQQDPTIIIDQSIEKIDAELNDATTSVQPLNDKLASVSDLFDKLKSKIIQPVRNDVDSYYPGAPKAELAATELLQLSNEISNVKSSIIQVHEKIEGTEDAVKVELQHLREAIAPFHISESKWTLERILRIISTFIGVIGLMYAFRQDRRNEMLLRQKSES